MEDGLVAGQECRAYVADVGRQLGRLACSLPAFIERRGRSGHVRLNKESRHVTSVSLGLWGRNVETPGLRSVLAGKLVRELGPRADVERPVDLRQGSLDCAVGDDENGGNFLVGLPFCDQVRDAPLGGSEPSSRRRPTPDPAKLGPGLLRPQLRSELVEDRQRTVQRFACRSLLPRTALDGAERKQGTRKLERLADAGREAKQIGRAHVLNSSHANISYAVFCWKKKNYRDVS